MIDLTTAVRNARDLDRRLATFERNERLGRYTGRNAAAQDRQIAAIEAALYGLIQTLTRQAPAVAGLLTAEADLRRRISRSRDEGIDRPELRARLRAVRADLRAV